MTAHRNASITHCASNWKLDRYLVALGITIAAVQPGARAQPAEKNGFPCVASLCLGDGIDDLRKITTWERATTPYGPTGKAQAIGDVRVDAAQMKALSTTYPSVPPGAAQYLLYERFDGQALPILATVNVACDFKEITGVFRSESGHPTTVKVALAAESRAKQRWAVTLIRRAYPDAVTQEQKSELYQHLKQQYAPWDRNRNTQLKHALMFGVNEASGPPFFYLGRIDLRNQAEMVKQHPACGGATKVKVE